MPQTDETEGKNPVPTVKSMIKPTQKNTKSSQI